jgi:hypothetical protein
MSSKILFVTVGAAAIGLILIARGCSGRNDRVAATKTETANSAATNAEAQSTDFSLTAGVDDDFDLPVREEIRQKRKLTRETMVLVVGSKEFGYDTDHTQACVIGVNGKVRVETADTDTAEVLIVRSARNLEDLQSKKVEINPDDNDNNLHIYLGNNKSPDSRRRVSRRILKEIRALGNNRSPETSPEIRQRVILKLPRQAGVQLRDIDGDVTVDGVGGHLSAYGVTGNIGVTRASGSINAGYINGDINITFAPLNANSVRLADDINGNIDLRFEGEVNAELNAYAINGAIKPEFSNVASTNSESEVGRLKTRIGNGSLGIEIRGINGNVTLSKAGMKDASALRE